MAARPESEARTGAPKRVHWATPPDLTGFIDVPADGGPQIFVPALTIDGELQLQPGESVLTSFNTIGAGIRASVSPVRQGGGSMEEMSGRCVVTNTRAVFVCRSWHLGRDLDSAGQDRARVLVGQVRWPWLASVSYASRSRWMDGLLEFRCVQRFDRRDNSVFLALVPAPDVDVDALVHTIVAAARDDRLGHAGFCPEKASRLTGLEIPAASSCWKSVGLPGAYKRMASTAAHGGESAAALAEWRYRLVERIHS